MSDLPRFRSYGQYTSDNYGAHTLVFTDACGNDFYYSYQTLVAFRTPAHGLFVRENAWGPTTGKHLNWIDGGRRDKRISAAEFSDALRECIAP